MFRTCVALAVGFACGLGAADARATCADLEASWQANHADLAAPQVSAVLFGAADQGCVDLARAVLAAGASVEARDRFGNMPLAHAAKSGQPALVGLLLIPLSYALAWGLWEYFARVSRAHHARTPVQPVV